MRSMLWTRTWNNPPSFSLFAIRYATHLSQCVMDGGVIIMLAKSNDGIGGDHFYHQMADEADINKIMDQLMNRGRGETLSDQ